jgi:hypothetical protein
MNSTNTTKFFYSLNYSATIKYSTKRNSMCYKKAAPLNYSKNAFLFAWQWQSMRTADRIFILSDILAIGPWQSDEFLFEDSSHCSWGTQMDSDSEHCNDQRGVSSPTSHPLQLVRCDAEPPHHRDQAPLKLGFSFKNLGLHQTLEKSGNMRPNQLPLLQLCESL